MGPEAIKGGKQQAEIASGNAIDPRTGQRVDPNKVRPPASRLTEGRN